MLCGLQGSGKTTMAAKLAKYLVKTGKKPCLAACDIYRPAAIKQLQVVGEQAGVPVFEKGTQDPVKTAQQAVEYCRDYGRDVLIIDTAGRLQQSTKSSWTSSPASSRRSSRRNACSWSTR